MHHGKQSFFSSNQPIILRKLIVPLLISSLPFVIETAEIALSLKKKKKYKTKDKLWFCKGFASTAVYTVGHFDQMDPVFTIFLL